MKFMKWSGVGMAVAGVGVAAVGIFVPGARITLIVTGLILIGVGVFNAWLGHIMRDMPKAPGLGASMKKASESLNQANLLMKNLNKGMFQGAPCKATVLAMRDTGMLINFNPVVDFDLLIALEGQPPFPLKHQECVNKLDVARIAPGPWFIAKVNAERTEVAVDWNNQTPAP